MNLKQLRYFDLDDLILLKLLLQPDISLSKVALALGLAKPAIVHRMNKYRMHIPELFDLSVGQRLTALPPKTRELCLKAEQALKAMEGL